MPALPDRPAHAYGVALLAEGVDRNIITWYLSVFAVCVALLAEGVDRNGAFRFYFWIHQQSPSSRRAWIEILLLKMQAGRC